ncbi:MAG: CoA transferase [Pseudonocardiaceae bacterium]
MTGEKSLPLYGIRVCERSRTLAGRLAGLLLADQGAEVFAFSRVRSAQEGLDDYLDRNKTFLPDIELTALANADILIKDGNATGTEHPWQTLGFTAIVPGDNEFDLPADASDDLLNGMVGFYTDLGVTSRLLGRDVIYTPLPLCSVYAAVLGATAVSAALTDRQRSGSGRSIVVPRLAAGLSAIGVLAMSLEGVDPYLLPPELLSLPPELMAEVPKARANEAHMLWLVNRISPTTGCYRTLDGRLMMPVTTVNRKLAIRMFEVLGIWERVLTLSVVDASPYDPASQSVKDRNVALVQGMRSDLNGQLAEWMEETFVQKTAAEWERLFGNAQVPCGAVQDFEEWKNCSWARQSGLVDAVAGLRHPQLGRSISVQSAKPYPALSAGRVRKSPLATNTSLPSLSGTPAIKPLSGYVVLDLANVIAGPACGRLLSELGATVFKMDTTRPDHQPLVTVIRGAEANQGKRSILADVRTAGGKAILRRLVKKADIVVMNATDSGTRQLGLSRDELAAINPRAIGVQISAFKGARPSTHDDFPGYDPLLQAATGIMTRFGTRDMPLLHGIASCVDYLTGYLGAFAATVALQARERRCDGSGDWVDTSLASGASLTQLLFQWGPPVASAVGPTATGPSSFARLCQQSDGWIFADASVDVSASLSGLNVADAIASLRMDGILAAPVRSIADLKQKLDLSQKSGELF